MDISPFISTSAPYLAAFLAGLFGGAHCAGMCGGIAGALAIGIQTGGQQSLPVRLLYLLSFNTGRITTYTIAGGLVGALGMLAGDSLAVYRSWMWLRIIAALFMIGMGLYLANWWSGATLALERMGAGLWQRLAPVTNRLLPIQHPSKAVIVGLLWGCLPCGLVYYTLIWAFASGGWLQGAGFLLCFGLGTLPTLLSAGLAANALGQILQSRSVRSLAGFLLISFGLWTLSTAIVYQQGFGLGCLPPE